MSDRTGTEKLRNLVFRCQQGDARSYGEIVDRFKDMAYGYAYAILGDFHLAEDAAQEAFAEAWRCPHNIEVPEAFPGWFKRIVFKQCERLTRKKDPVVQMESADGVPSQTGDPVRTVMRTDMKERVLAAVRGLPEAQRTVTTLFYINGYSHEEIAGFLDVPVGTVKSRLHSSRKRLKERTELITASKTDEEPKSSISPSTEFWNNGFRSEACWLSDYFPEMVSPRNRTQGKMLVPKSTRSAEMPPIF